MYSLQYRLLDEGRGFPLLFDYNVEIDELIARMSCQYLVKDDKEYKAVSNATESNGVNVIYVSEGTNRLFATERFYDGIGFEVREWKNDANTDVLHVKQFNTHYDALPILHSDYIYIPQGGRQAEFELDSLEIDEVRRCYVYYGKFTGVTV